MKNNLIFLWWINWVWKTTIWWQIAKKLWIKHIIASDIIKKLEIFNIDKKNEKDISNESEIIVKYIKNYFWENNTIIFDAHFVLKDSKNNLIKIKKDIFKKIDISKIIIIIDDIKNIKEKLKKRDFKNYELNFLKYFQDEELKYSQEIAQELNIEHNIFDITEIWINNLEEVLINYFNENVWTN